MDSDDNLTGVWHGVYTYATQPHMPESHFVCVLIDSSGNLSGTIYEEMNHYRSAPTHENATVQGTHNAGLVDFIKTYDGSGKSKHSVMYSGRIDAVQDEIEGTWKIGGFIRNVAGRFLMIRRRAEKTENSEEIAAGYVREFTHTL